MRGGTKSGNRLPQPRVRLKLASLRADVNLGMARQPAPEFEDRWELYRCRGCGAAVLGWPEELLHGSIRCPGKREDSGFVQRLVLAVVAVEPLGEPPSV